MEAAAATNASFRSGPWYGMPDEAAQVDFGAGPMLTHSDGQEQRTWP